MKNYLIADRYSNGLSAAIEDSMQLEPALAALRELSELYLTNRDLRSALANPAVDLHQREKLLKQNAWVFFSINKSFPPIDKIILQFFNSILLNLLV